MRKFNEGKMKTSNNDKSTGLYLLQWEGNGKTLEDQTGKL